MPYSNSKNVNQEKTKKKGTTTFKYYLYKIDDVCKRQQFQTTNQKLDNGNFGRYLKKRSKEHIYGKHRPRKESWKNRSGIKKYKMNEIASDAGSVCWEGSFIDIKEEVDDDNIVKII